ncbi:hypothetical protein EDD86DRAFT_84816 [Gorgonomyces haynaldii]|nr:hypothetical protein EDD86DRAFT_84816 [Gorgonomyces haynaldii]
MKFHSVVREAAKKKLRSELDGFDKHDQSKTNNVYPDLLANKLMRMHLKEERLKDPTKPPVRILYCGEHPHKIPTIHTVKLPPLVISPSRPQTESRKQSRRGSRTMQKIALVSRYAYTRRPIRSSKHSATTRKRESIPNSKERELVEFELTESDAESDIFEHQRREKEWCQQLHESASIPIHLLESAFVHPLDISKEEIHYEQPESEESEPESVQVMLRRKPKMHRRRRQRLVLVAHPAHGKKNQSQEQEDGQANTASTPEPRPKVNSWWTPQSSLKLFMDSKKFVEKEKEEKAKRLHQIKTKFKSKTIFHEPHDLKATKTTKFKPAKSVMSVIAVEPNRDQKWMRSNVVPSKPQE